MRGAVGFDELAALAPGTDRTLLRVVAGLLGCGAHAGELRATTRVLTDTSAQLLGDGRLLLAVEMLAVASVLDLRIDELARRPGIWR